MATSGSPLDVWISWPHKPDTRQISFIIWLTLSLLNAEGCNTELQAIFTCHYCSIGTPPFPHHIFDHVCDRISRKLVKGTVREALCTRAQWRNYTLPETDDGRSLFIFPLRAIVEMHMSWTHYTVGDYFHSCWAQSWRIRGRIQRGREFHLSRIRTRVSLQGK